MTGEHDRDPVAVHDRADGSSGPGTAHGRPELAVGLCLAVGDAGELAEHRGGERQHLAEVERQLEGAPSAGEGLVEIAAGEIDASGERGLLRRGEPVGGLGELLVRWRLVLGVFVCISLVGRDRRTTSITTVRSIATSPEMARTHARRCSPWSRRG